MYRMDAATPDAPNVVQTTVRIEIYQISYLLKVKCILYTILYGTNWYYLLYIKCVQTVLRTFSNYIQTPSILYGVGVSSPVRFLNMLEHRRPPCNMAVG